MAVESYASWISSIGVIVASFGNMETTVYLAARSYRDKKAMIVDERRINSFEELWLIVQSVDHEVSRANGILSKTDRQRLREVLSTFIQSQKSIYVDDRAEQAMKQIFAYLGGDVTGIDVAAKIELLKASIRRKL